ncbi:MAG: antibiotic biosynthesis monooxygenase [Candidatus Rokubacteria bacterium]|nr:antibiotic biosynthesis monooxygenase [Candidatus Rokubacteria bacterium]
MANVLTVVAKLSAKPGKGDELAAILREQVAAVLKAEPDCLVYEQYRSDRSRP